MLRRRAFLWREQAAPRPPRAAVYYAGWSAAAAAGRVRVLMMDSRVPTEPSSGYLYLSHTINRLWAEKFGFEFHFDDRWLKRGCARHRPACFHPVHGGRAAWRSVWGRRGGSEGGVGGGAVRHGPGRRGAGGRPAAGGPGGGINWRRFIFLHVHAGPPVATRRWWRRGSARGA